MPKFNPFKSVNCQYGAPMGRRGDTIANYNGGKLYARHCGGDGFYDRGGAYWGHSKIYAVWTRGGAFCTYIEAASKESAIKKVQEESGILWNVRIYDNGGESVDRYTAVFTDRPEPRYSNFFGSPNYEALAFNDSPFHPLGFGQHTSAAIGRHLGKRVDFLDLPPQAQKFVLNNL